MITVEMRSGIRFALIGFVALMLIDLVLMLAVLGATGHMRADVALPVLAEYTWTNVKISIGVLVGYVEGTKLCA